ncbi:metal-sulfur cluster assembly factor [Corynebacterium vitaeruminis]|uniref:MIP18 family-like domain-containing protein n=1 Tax=Corynebacterium vitaeruminis DSM 20294 TaxID=1224164 RepID=W5Y8N0_9CORY|nr:metal-sulfur cluster assembly factor [Corynebacterium vitaeruminis]AHI22848.1 hypothetical protein B843_07315 [Corynebacterium vitaeruminis DSM 20294]
MSEENTPVEGQGATEPAAADSTAVESSLADAGLPERPPQTDADIAKAAEVEEYMRDVIDPELGINVVDLGLVYDIWMENGNEAQISMTLTSPACPLTDVLEDQAQTAVVGNGIAEKLTINWVWMPPWGPHMISEEGREMLRAIGFSV